MADAVSPGGPRVSAAKKRRLAALENSLAVPGRVAGSDAASKRSRGLAPVGGRAGARQASPAGGATPSSSAAASSRSDARQAAEQHEQEPIYAPLAAELASGGPLALALQLPEPASGGAGSSSGPSSGREVVASLLEELLSTNPRRGLDARAAIGLKVADRVLLLDNPASTHAAGRGRRRDRGLSQRLASKSRQRQEGLYNLSAAGLTYEQVLPLHQRWRQYISTLVAGAGSGGGAGGVGGGQQQRGSSGGGSTAGTAGAAGGAGTPAEAAALLGAEMHGCLLRVAESDEQRWRGVEGIVVRDTQLTFVVVTKEGRVQTLPKRRCVFEYGLGRGRVVRLLGRNLVPPVGRSAKGSLGAGQRKK